MESNMNFETWRQTWFDHAESLGHALIRNEYGVDNFVTDCGYHNGPGCSKCNETWCMHCEDYTTLERCTR